MNRKTSDTDTENKRSEMKVMKQVDFTSCRSEWMSNSFSIRFDTQTAYSIQCIQQCQCISLFYMFACVTCMCVYCVACTEYMKYLTYCSAGLFWFYFRFWGFSLLLRIRRSQYVVWCEVCACVHVWMYHTYSVFPLSLCQIHCIDDIDGNCFAAGDT